MVESDLQTKNPAALYSDILVAAYDELSRRSARRGLLDATALDSAITGIEGPESGVETHSHASEQSPAAVAFAASLAKWPIFPDTPAALARLSALGLKLAVLSNVDRTSFAHTRIALERSGRFAFGAVYTAEDIGSYKFVATLSSCTLVAAVVRRCSLADYDTGQTRVISSMRWRNCALKTRRLSEIKFLSLRSPSNMTMFRRERSGCPQCGSIVRTL